MNAAAMDESQSLRDLTLIAGEDEATARDAFERLTRLTRHATFRQLRGRGLTLADVEDLTQEVYTRLWRYRKGVQARNLATWYSLTRTTAARVVADRFGRVDRFDLEELPEEIPDIDYPVLEEFVEAMRNTDFVNRAADDLWLGACLSERDRTVGAATVQMVIFEELSPEEAANLFGITVEEVCGWLSDPAVISRALFAGLCWSNDELAGYVLRPDEPLTQEELDAVSSARTDLPDGLAWDGLEAQIVLWRVRNGLSDDQILRQTGFRYNGSELQQLVAALAKTYPYASETRRLKTALDPLLYRASVASSGLWKRIAFEYRAVRDLPHRQILERAEDAANEGGYLLNGTKLNNWFGMGRLYSQLASKLSQLQR